VTDAPLHTPNASTWLRSTKGILSTGRHRPGITSLTSTCRRTRRRRPTTITTTTTIDRLPTRVLPHGMSLHGGSRPRSWRTCHNCIQAEPRHAQIQSRLQGSVLNTYKTLALGFRQLWIIHNDFLGLGVARLQPLRDPASFVRLLSQTEKLLDQKLLCQIQTSHTTYNTSPEQRVVVIPAESSTRWTK
jgi:hypothetical protein